LAHGRWRSAGGGGGSGLQAQLDAQRLVEFGGKAGRQLPDPPADALDGDRADLLSLCLGVAGQAGFGSGQQNLERVDARDIGGHGHDGDETAAEAGCRARGLYLRPLDAA
jgi:hypothetical protein